MNVAVGLVQDRPAIRAVLEGNFLDEDGRRYGPGACVLARAVTLTPEDPARNAFMLEDVTIGVGFHWERPRPLRFRGALRVVASGAGWTAVNDVDLESYVAGVIAAEMNPASPELLKAHAIISRSWAMAEIGRTDRAGSFRELRETGPGEWELRAWYGREAHSRFDVCADDHCQRYQGIPEAHAGRAARAAAETAHQFLVHGGSVANTRFSKCCGGVTEAYPTAWDDREVPYLRPVVDGPGPMPRIDREWFLGRPEACCNTADDALLERILPGFDRETTAFFRWDAAYTPSELGEIVWRRSGIDVGEVTALEALERGVSGRIRRLRIRGRAGTLVVGKELEIRRVLSSSHLYSSAFIAEVSPEAVRLRGAGWGHGVGLCQIGAAVRAERGRGAGEILARYYPGTTLESRA